MGFVVDLTMHFLENGNVSDYIGGYINRRSDTFIY